MAVMSLVLMAVVLYGASPFLAMWQLERAMDRGDAVSLEKRVDWRSVRDGLKQDIADGIIGPVQTQLTANALPPFGASFMMGLADTAIEREVTPQNLIAVMRQMRPATAPANPFASFDWAFFDGPFSFSVIVHSDGDEEDGHLRIRLELRGGVWTVVRAWIPQDIVERAAQRT
jgi:hypothetical protein